MSGSNWVPEEKRLRQKPGMSCPMTFTKRERTVLTTVTMVQLGLLTNVYRILTCIIKQSLLQTGPLGSGACSDGGSAIMEGKEEDIECKKAKEMEERS